MILLLEDMNAFFGFWRAWMPVKPGGWPRAYMWNCGCCGVSHEGRVVGVSPCSDHQEKMEKVMVFPLPQEDLYGIKRMCSEAFKHLALSNPVQEKHAVVTAIACLEASKGKANE